MLLRRTIVTSGMAPASAYIAMRPLLISICLMLACGSLQAQSSDATPAQSPSFEQHGRWGNHRGGWIWKELNLTDTQKADLKTYRQQHKTEFRAALANVLAARLKLQQDINANDQTAITTDATTLGQAAAQLAKARAAEFSYLAGILNPDQTATLQSLQQKRQARMQDWINKLNQPGT